jgi:hypothetical protein
VFVYYNRNEHLNIEPPDGVSILLIRITSPWFRISDGLSTGYTFEQILRNFAGRIPTATAVPCI